MTTTLHNIQVLRSFTALLVVMHHAYPHYEAMGGDLYVVQVISEWGFIGVDMFFNLLLMLLCVIFSLIYYRKIEKPMYQKAIHFKRAV